MTEEDPDILDIVTILRSPDRVEPYTCNAAANEIERLRKELADAYSKSVQVLADLSANLCTASALERERLTAERDEARRAACKGEAIIRLQRNRVHRESEEVVLVAKEISVERGWDCFKENS